MMNVISLVAWVLSCGFVVGRGGQLLIRDIRSFKARRIDAAQDVDPSTLLDAPPHPSDEGTDIA